MEYRQIVHEHLDVFFREVYEQRNDTELVAFFDFLHRMPFHAPFNNALVFVQNPACTYYATEKQWNDNFDRTVNPGARVMLILRPFGPVDFVYDLADTSGPPLPEDRILFWWEEKRGGFDTKRIAQTVENCKHMAIVVHENTDYTYIQQHGSLHTMGVARRSRGDFSVHLHPRYADKDFPIEAYGVLCHEIAHILLGHLGPFSVPVHDKRMTTGVPKKEIATDRSHLKHHVEEVEAELVAWMVFDMLGMEKNSAGYIAGYMRSKDTLPDFSMSHVLKVAKTVFDMSQGLVRW